MKRLLCLYMVIVLLLVGCSPSQVAKTDPPEETGESEASKYRTLLSPDNKLSIVRKPSAADFSSIHPGKMTDLPKYDSNSEELWQVDLRSSDLTGLDLSGDFADLIYASFDSKTKWPDKLADGFDPDLIMELGKNPGLGVGELHKKGITGKGMGIAIIDQGLLVDHIEYKDQLKSYEEIHCIDEDAAMHGPAVASIAVGKNVGVAPEANLYYIAETHGTFKEGEFEWDLSWLAKSIDRVVEINKTLPKDKKIRVISISLGVGGVMDGYEKVYEAIDKAKQDGIYTVYVDSNPYMGLGRDPLTDPDDVTSYSRGLFWEKFEYNNHELLIPMDSRCTASPTGVNDYVFYREGGMSWTTPYIAGLYALACQVKPDITPNVFWEEALNTGDTISKDDGELGKIINPMKLIERLQ